VEHLGGEGRRRGADHQVGGWGGVVGVAVVQPVGEGMEERLVVVGQRRGSARGIGGLWGGGGGFVHVRHRERPGGAPTGLGTKERPQGGMRASVRARRWYAWPIGDAAAGLTRRRSIFLLNVVVRGPEISATVEVRNRAAVRPDVVARSGRGASG